MNLFENLHHGGLTEFVLLLPEGAQLYWNLLLPKLEKLDPAVAHSLREDLLNIAKFSQCCAILLDIYEKLVQDTEAHRKAQMRNLEVQLDEAQMTVLAGLFENSVLQSEIRELRGEQ